MVVNCAIGKRSEPRGDAASKLSQGFQIFFDYTITDYIFRTSSIMVMWPRSYECSKLGDQLGRILNQKLENQTTTLSFRVSMKLKTQMKKNLLYIIDVVNIF